MQVVSSWKSKQKEDCPLHVRLYFANQNEYLAELPLSASTHPCQPSSSLPVSDQSIVQGRAYIYAAGSVQYEAAVNGFDAVTAAVSSQDGIRLSVTAAAATAWWWCCGAVLATCAACSAQHVPTADCTRQL